MNKDTCLIVDASNGPFVFDKRRQSVVKATAVRRASHGDWKTQSVRNEFMGMEEGETGELIDVFDNFDGRWCRVRMGDGKTADIKPSDLKILPRT